MKKQRKEKPHSEKCGDCFYNEEGKCNVNPDKCIYLIEVEEDE